MSRTPNPNSLTLDVGQALEGLRRKGKNPAKVRAVNYLFQTDYGEYRRELKLRREGKAFYLVCPLCGQNCIELVVFNLQSGVLSCRTCRANS